MTRFAALRKLHRPFRQSLGGSFDLATCCGSSADCSECRIGVHAVADGFKRRWCVWIRAESWPACPHGARFDFYFFRWSGLCLGMFTFESGSSNLLGQLNFPELRSSTGSGTLGCNNAMSSYALQYQPFGSEGFDQDTSRFNSSKPGPYSDAFFIDGPHPNQDPWSTSSSLQSSSYSYANSVIGIPATHPPPTSSAFSTMHLPPEPMGYNTASTSHDPSLMANSLPPMSSFRDPSSHRTSMAHSSASPLYGQTTSPPSPLSSTDPLVNRGAQPTQTGDTLGKALASIYSTEPSANSFSSTPATPVSSPSPLSGVTHWSRSGNHAAPPPNSGYSEGTLLPLQGRLEDRIDEAFHILRDHAEQSRGVMEERLDDAINILRNHAEGPGLQPVPPNTALNDISPVTAHSNGLLATQSYPGVAIISLDPHVTGPTNLPDNVLRSRSSQPGSSGQLAASQSFGLPPDALPSIKDKVKEVEKSDLSRVKSATPNANSTPSISTPTGNSISGTPPVSSPTSTSSTNTATNIGSSKGTKRSRTSSSGDEDEVPEIKAEKDKERRQANNARERIRVRDINEAFKELGRMCMVHLKADKAQTKLNILHQAVDVITNLEQQVRERNLNPKAACLKRREEEKNEEGPKLGMHTIPHPQALDSLTHQRLATSLPGILAPMTLSSQCTTTFADGHDIDPPLLP
ncbi:transcription factor 12-like isoform X2 [Uloborus diversus]|uniref:transcription factor 12-like isoform X2 n=1 Tax=Uloborus diversus TaxID=327109 RepID=UPI00240A68EE|nr:transcription factor 12-like isoform X2 [Uloborus diversus]